ncbi:putative DMT superfamily transporter inner membrane protein [compost metagenome]
MMYGGALLFILSLATEHVHPEILLSFKTAGSLLYLTVVGSMVGHTLFYWLVAKTNPVFPSTWLYISPPIAVGVGFLFYHEAVTWITILGVFTIIAGTVLVNAGALKQMLFKKQPAAPVLPKDAA